MLPLPTPFIGRPQIPGYEVPPPFVLILGSMMSRTGHILVEVPGWAISTEALATRESSLIILLTSFLNSFFNISYMRTGTHKGAALRQNLISRTGVQRQL